LATNKSQACTPRAHFFSFGKGGGYVGFLLFTNVFTSNSQCVFTYLPSSQCVPKHVPDSTSLYPISFALSSTFITYIITPKGRDYNTSILEQFKALFNFFVMGKSKMHITKEKSIWTLGSPQLIDTSQTVGM
jgi:hypothetical protein